MLVFDDVQPSEKVRMYDKRFRPGFLGDSYADFQSAYHHGDVHIPSISNSEALKLEVLDFINAIVTGKPPLSDGRSGLRVVEALEAASDCLLRRKRDGAPRSAQHRANWGGGFDIGIQAAKAARSRNWKARA